MTRPGLIALAGVCFASALAFGWIFYELYWRWRSCFNQLGRCFLPEDGVVVSDNNFVWALFTWAALALALLFWLWSRRIAP